MKQKTCHDCGKKTQDIFYLQVHELISPSGTINAIGNGFCLRCYTQKSNQIRGECYVL